MPIGLGKSRVKFNTESTHKACNNFRLRSCRARRTEGKKLKSDSKTCTTPQYIYISKFTELSIKVVRQIRWIVDCPNHVWEKAQNIRLTTWNSYEHMFLAVVNIRGKSLENILLVATSITFSNTLLPFQKQFKYFRDNWKYIAQSH